MSAPELSLGRIVHEALQVGYDTGRPFPEAYRELLPEYEPAESTLFAEFRERAKEDLRLGLQMMKGYQKWYKQADADFRFLATETYWDFVSLGDNGARLSGVFDALVERDDGLWVLDFKTTKRSITDWTTQDLQATAYVHAAREMYGEEVQGVIFRFLLKKAPYDYNDLILKSGKVTTRKNLDNLTSYENYYRAIAISVLHDKLPNNTLEECEEMLHDASKSDEFQAAFTLAKKKYWSQLQSLRGASSQYYWDEYEYRSPLQVHNYMNNVIIPAAEELRKPRYVGPTGLAMAWASCGRCPFRAPCKMAMDGADYKTLLQEEFEVSPRYQEEVDDEADDEG